MDIAVPGGIHCVLYALFDRREQIDRGLMRAQIEAVLGAGVSGVTVLGLATEVGKLTAAERLQLMQMAASDVAGRLPLSITINGASVAEQIEHLRAAEDCGADWLILQPPAIGPYPQQNTSTFSAASPTPRANRSRSRMRRPISAAG